VLVTGLGTPNDMRSFVKDGTVKEFALWNPEELGYLTVYAIQALVKGEYTVGADKTVLLGDPYKFNAENIDNFNF
jgi:rhamnose transport system substrate-binding protein